MGTALVREESLGAVYVALLVKKFDKFFYNDIF